MLRPPCQGGAMATFTATTRNREVVPAERAEIWQALSDPTLLPKLTPYLDKITVDGDHWRWEMTRLPVLSVVVAPAFTERMEFDEKSRIEFTHDPPQGQDEKAAAEGTYHLKDAGPGKTDLSIELTLQIDLPLPRAAAPAVGRVMRTVMNRMGQKFATNLMDHLR